VSSSLCTHRNNQFHHDDGGDDFFEKYICNNNTQQKTKTKSPFEIGLITVNIVPGVVPIARNRLPDNLLNFVDGKI
jgi:hypothetical protein